MIIINKIDAENINLPQLLARIQATFGKECCRSICRRTEVSVWWTVFFTPHGESDFSSVEEAHQALGRPGWSKSTRR